MLRSEAWLAVAGAGQHLLELVLGDFVIPFRHLVRFALQKDANWVAVATFDELDKNGDGRVTFEEFDELVPFETRLLIESKLTEEGGAAEDIERQQKRTVRASSESSRMPPWSMSPQCRPLLSRRASGCGESGRSYSPSLYMEGISAVSPPMRPQLERRQPSAMPSTMDAVWSTLSLPVAK